MGSKSITNYELGITMDFYDRKILPFGSAQGAIWVDSSPAAQKDSVTKRDSETSSEGQK